MATRSEIVEKAREYIGTPFHHQGRRKGVGIDCSGLVVCVCRDLVLPLGPVPADYPKTVRPRFMQQMLEKLTTPIPLAEASSGDLVLLRQRRGKHERHLGILSPGGMIHAERGMDGVVETPMQGWLRDLFHSSYRLPGVAD